MLQNVLSNLIHRPATRNFPASVREPIENVRGEVEFIADNCIYCGACALRCPTDAIEVNRQEKTLKFDFSMCVVCGCCAEACKKGGVQMSPAYHAPVYTKSSIEFHGTPAPKAEEPSNN